MPPWALLTSIRFYWLMVGRCSLRTTNACREQILQAIGEALDGIDRRGKPIKR